MRKLLLIGLVLTLGTSAKAGEMRTFFLSCAYGTGIGALAGLTALAFSEQPGNNLGYITRGASIGLYTGMGIGYYMISKPEVEVRGDTQPSAQHQPFETETVFGREPNLPSMPVVAVLPGSTRDNLTADLFVGYRLSLP